MERLDREPERLEQTRLVPRPGNGHPWRYALAGSAVTAVIASGALYGMMRHLPNARAAPAPTQDVCARASVVTAPAPPPPAPIPPPADSAAAIPSPSASVAAEADPAPNPKSPKRARGTLSVVCLPQCDSIVDNGKWIGNGNVFNRPVPAGRHVLLMTANGVRKTVVAEVQPDTPREVRVPMEDGVKTTSSDRSSDRF